MLQLTRKSCIVLVGMRVEGLKCNVLCVFLCSGTSVHNCISNAAVEESEPKSATCEDRTHDLGIMRPTRCRLR